MRCSGRVADHEIQPRVDARLARRQILFGTNPPRLFAFLDESVLFRMPGATDVMRRQLACLLQMAQRPNRLRWRKSSYSSDHGPECVEIAATRDAVAVRDSANSDGAVLVVSHSVFAAFIAKAKGDSHG